MHFKIHCKELQKQDYISFHNIFILNNSHNNMNIKFIVKVYVFFVLLKTWIKITTKSHVLLKKNPKTTIEICGILKQNLWFSTVSTCNYSFSSFPDFVSKRSPYFSKLSSFEPSQVTSPWSKPTRIQNSN